jgi:hypothetical protein
MAGFECASWLTVSVIEDCEIFSIKITHREDHVPYWSIDIPADVQTYVQENQNMTPKQVRARI